MNSPTMSNQKQEMKRKFRYGSRNLVLWLAAFGMCLIGYALGAEATFSYKSSTMNFNSFRPDNRECKVYLATIIIFDCAFEYHAYQRNYLIQNSD